MDRDKTLRLSFSQKAVFDGWKRPAQLIEQFRGSDKPTVARSETVKDLVQDITTDCSVVASLCAATARHERGHDSVRP